MKRNPIACLESWADELLSRASRVRNLIGDAHWLSDGHYKEELVREYLVRHLPSSLRVSRGFICSTDAATRVSPELDVLITDQESELPWFSEGGLVIAPPSAVRGQLHVKTEFGAKEITEVLESVFNACESCEPQRDPSTLWGGGVFFSHTDCETEEACSRRFLGALKKYLERHTDLRRQHYLPDCIAIVKGPVITVEKLRPNNEGRMPVIVRMFSCNNLSVAILLSHFYDSLTDRGRNMSKRGEWTQILQQVNYPMILEQSLQSDKL